MIAVELAALVGGTIVTGVGWVVFETGKRIFEGTRYAARSIKRSASGPPRQLSYKDLQQEHVLLDSEIPALARGKTKFAFSSTDVGVYEVVVKNAGVPFEKILLRMDDLCSRTDDRVTLNESFTFHVGSTVQFLDDLFHHRAQVEQLLRSEAVTILAAPELTAEETSCQALCVPADEVHRDPPRVPLEESNVQNGTIEDDQVTGMEHGQCVVCLSAEPEYVFFPCCHLCLCDRCGTQSSLKTCPLCRKNIVSCLKTFRP